MVGNVSDKQTGSFPDEGLRISPTFSLAMVLRRLHLHQGVKLLQREVFDSIFRCRYLFEPACPGPCLGGEFAAERCAVIENA